MHIAQYEAYKRWLEKWLPHVVYGASAGGASPPVAPSHAARSASLNQQLLALPGGQIVRAES